MIALADASLPQSPLRTFIRSECANSIPGDGCLLCRPGCRVLHGRRCKYFEAAVLPLLTTYPSARCLRTYPNAAAAYRKINPMTADGPDTEALRACSCGAPLPPHRRFCEKCLKTRSRESYYRRKANNVPDTPPNAPGLRRSHAEGSEAGFARSFIAQSS